MKKRMWPTQNTESVNIEVGNTFPTIYHVLRYRGPGCICKLPSYKSKI